MAMNMDAMLRIKADVQGENNIRRLGGSLQGLQGQAKIAAMGFNSLKGAVVGLGAAIAGSAIVAGFGAMVKRTIDLGDELGKMSARTGVAQNALIALRNAAALSDVSNESLGKSLTKLNVNLVKAAEGNDALAGKFKRLGVDVKGADGQVVSADKAMKQLADRFRDMPDGAQKAAAAVDIFGKSGAELIPLLNSGSEAMEKFTYKVSDDFSARSELFNDTITELGFKTQGFQLQLTDALMPALQSILEVFGDLFDTKNDWTALFEAIKVGIRSVATVLYAMIKLVDQFVKAIVYSFDAIGKALQGDFAGAGQALSSGFGAGIEQARRDFEQIGKIWTDAPSPGTGSSRRGGSGMDLDTSAADARNAAAGRRAAADSARLAKEQERLAERRNDLTQKAISLQEQLRNSVVDVGAAYARVGVSSADLLFLDRGAEITKNDRQIKALTLSVVELMREIEAAGGSLDVQPFRELINSLSDANVALADKQYLQGLKDLLPSLEEYDSKIAEITRGKTELTELEKLNAQANLLQLDILAQTNPALAEHIRLLRERAAALDEATKKQEENASSFGTQFTESFKQAYESATNLGANLAGIATSGIESLTDAITNFAITGKASFREFASSVLQDLSKMLIKFAIFKAVTGIFNAFGGGGGAALGFGGASDPLGAGGSFWNANGNAFGANGIIPFARGGIVNNPTLFKFANGGAMRTGIMGEAGPEAIMPLKRGPDGKLGVASAGGGSTNVVINVDASGTKASGDPGAANALGRDLAAVVDSRLIYHKRPGGLLAAQ
jgi:hypothetical protein